MKQKTKKRIQGSISVLLIIILLPTMVLSALIVDTSRINMARSMVSSAGDLAINSALADYDTILKDVYGLFAMSQAKTDEQLAAEIKEYFEDTLVSYGVTTEAEAGDYVTALMGDFNELVSGTGSAEVSNFLDMEIGTDFTVTKEAESGLDNPQIMRKQIVDYMKYRAPADFALSFLDSAKAFTTVEDQSQVLALQVKAQESLQPVTQGCKTVITGIRDFDTLVTAINSGDQAVTGLDNSTDGVIVEIAKYHEQIDKYKSVWGENYKNINELTLVFLMNSPEVTDKYLSDMSYSQNEFFISAEDINTDKSGISIEVSLADNYDDAAIQVEQQKSKLSGMPYSRVGTEYNGEAFLDRLNMDTNKTDFLKREEAIAAFIKFEAFLLNDTSKSSITYDEVADTLEQLCVLRMYHDNQISMLNDKIDTKKEERDNKKKELDKKTEEMNAAEAALQNGKAAQEAVQTTAATLEAAKSAVSTAASALSTAQGNLSSYTGKKSGTAYRNLEKAVEDAQSALEEAVAAQESAQSAYDNAVAAAPSDSEIAQMERTLSTKKAEHATLTGEYQILRDEVASLESTKKLAVSEYKNSISAYMSFTNAYQHDLELYEDYKSVAKQLITKDAKAIQEQLVKIEDNIVTILDALNQIGADLSTLKLEIEDYNNNVAAWDEQNKQYVDANSADAFSKQNAADIEATHSQYDLESLKTLLDYVMIIEQEYRDFYDYITNADRYQYGNARIDTLDSDEKVLSAIPTELSAGLPDIITQEEANNQLNTLFADETTPSIEIDKLTFVKDGVLPIQFLKYLNENYPEEEKNLTLETESDETASNPKDQYEQLKSEMQTDKKGDNAINSVDGNSYGYTFQTRGNLPKAGLPSAGKFQKTADNQSMQITGDEGSVDASSSLQKQGDNLSSAIGNVESVLGAGLENIYIVDYIFQNFSYNTLVQEMVVEGENLTTYPQVMQLSSHENLGNYLGTAKTLSNYNIAEENNYLYGAEIEYILFGNEKPQTNVTYTKGSIYAIRFAFNSIFAFTDSEIRNTTMAAGLSVQAATMGIVPYQLVQVVLQLALAAAESAIDLDMMSKGLKVVVVKTRDTWSMSVSGAIGLMTDSLQAVAGDKISDAISSAINVVNEGINTVMEASAEELEDAVVNLTNTVSNAAKSKGEEIVDGVYVELQSQIDTLLNELQFAEFYTDYPDGTVVYMTQAEVLAEINSQFEKLRAGVDGIMAKYVSNPMAEFLRQQMVDYISGSDGIIDKLQNKINAAVAAAYAEAPEQPDVGGVLCGQMLQIKYDVLTGLQDSIESMEFYINRAAESSIAKITGELNTYAQQCVTESGEKLEETLTTEVKDKVVDSLNEFSNTYLKEAEHEKVDLGAGGEGGSKNMGSKVASMVKFGYRDYLMLLVFISVCANDDAVLSRTADVIQLNLENATGETEKGRIVFQHQKGSDFTLAEAKTYVSVEGSVKLDMLLLDMDFFSRMLGEDSVSVSEQTKAVSTIKYKGIAGY